MHSIHTLLGNQHLKLWTIYFYLKYIMYILLANTAKGDTLAVAKNSREVTTTQFGSTEKIRLLHKHLPTYRKRTKRYYSFLVSDNVKHL